MVAPAFLKTGDKGPVVCLEKENLNRMRKGRQKLQLVEKLPTPDVHDSSYFIYIDGLLAELDKFGQQLGREVVHAIVPHIFKGMHGNSLPRT